MKRYMLYLLFFTCFLSPALFAQHYKKAIEDQFLTYTNFIIKQDFKSAADYIIEDFFTIIPKEQMILAMETVLKTPGMDYAIDSAHVLRISDTTQISDKQYAKIKYSNIIRMRFDGDSTHSPTGLDTINTENELLTLSLQSKFGEENVRYDTATHYYHIYSEKDVIAMSKDMQNWKFIVLEQDKMPFLKKFIPQELLKDKPASE